MNSKTPRLEIQIHETNMFSVLDPPPANFADLRGELNAFLDCQSAGSMAHYRIAYVFSNENEASIFSEKSYAAALA